MDGWEAFFTELLDPSIERFTFGVGQESSVPLSLGPILGKAGASHEV